MLDAKVEPDPDQAANPSDALAALGVLPRLPLFIEFSLERSQRRITVQKQK
jgi:hypothetical protein